MLHFPKGGSLMFRSISMVLAIVGVFLAVPGALALDPPDYTFTLRECVERALSQNTNVLLARLEQRDARARAESTADPYSLRLSVGSGLAWTSGFPMNVGGSGPSLVNAQASMTLFDRAQRFRVLQARENARGFSFDEEEQRRAVALEVARIYLDAEALQQAHAQSSQELASLERLANIRKAQQEEGRVLPLDVKLSDAELGRARYRARQTETALLNAQATLAFVLGLEGGKRVAPAAESRLPVQAPATRDEAVSIALKSHPGIAKLESKKIAARYQMRAAKSSHWPIVRLVSQYSMFSRFNNYDRFYNHFERHNGQLGASFELPIFTGKGPRAEAEQAGVEEERLRLQDFDLRRQVILDTDKQYREMEDAQAYHALATLELDVARERVSVLLARSGEGRATLEDLEAARADEARKWAEYYRSRAAAELAALELLGQTGQLLAQFQ
jgi:outer membrane protein